MKNPVITAPDGMRIPEEIKPGDTFNAMASFKLLQGGKLELCAIDGEMLGQSKKEMTTADRFSAEYANV